MWRVLMGIGMVLHRIAPPSPPRPNFKRKISTTIAPQDGHIILNFYVPPDYESRRRMHGRRYPVVVNFHGGGFTLGTAKDDARWCKVVVDEVCAVVVSVDYRLAPEHPFPTAVEDGCDAILYLALHADEFHLDVDRIAVSGFSSGGNMAFTVPLRLQEEVLQVEMGEVSVDCGEGSSSSNSSDNNVARSKSPKPPKSPTSPVRAPTMSTDAILKKAMTKGDALVSVQQQIKLRALVSWYPSTDYTHTREQRRATCKQQDHQLPAIFTNLFDESYLQPPTLDMSNPYLSPGVAPDYMLAGLPDDIILFTCEWDMLLAEGERLRDRLIGPGLNKNVRYQMVPNAAHGWDKAPNPIRQPPDVMGFYLQACEELKRVFGVRDDDASLRRESIVAFAAARRSVCEGME